MNTDQLTAYERIPTWIQRLKAPILLGWKIYYISVIRMIAVKHWIKGEIPFREMFSILRPNGLKPKVLDSKDAKN